MALSPLMNVPILSQDSVIEIVGKGDGSQENDELFITTTLELGQEIDAQNEVTLLLPLASDAQQQPLMRYVADPVQEATTFDPVERSDYDQAVADALQALQAEEREEQEVLAKAIADAAKSFSQAVLTVKPGQRRLRFFYTVAANRTPDGLFEARVFGPLASFVIQPGGSLGVVALLARGATLVEAVALTNPDDEGSRLPSQVEGDLGGRHCIGWTWQNDPLFRIRYRY